MSDPSKEWPEELKARLEVLWAEGHSTAEIGRRLGGITKNAVVAKAHRMNLPGRASPIRRHTPGAQPKPAQVRRVTGPTLPSLAAPLPALGEAGPAPAPIPAPPPAPRPAPPPAERPEPGSRFACCWPIGEPGTKGFHFCGEHVAKGKNYCPEHHARAALRLKPEAREPANLKRIED